MLGSRGRSTGHPIAWVLDCVWYTHTGFVDPPLQKPTHGASIELLQFDEMYSCTGRRNLVTSLNGLNPFGDYSRPVKMRSTRRRFGRVLVVIRIPSGYRSVPKGTEKSRVQDDSQRPESGDGGWASAFDGRKAALPHSGGSTLKACAESRLLVEWALDVKPAG